MKKKKSLLPDDDTRTLKPGPFKTKADMKLIEKVNQMLQQVYDLLPGERVLITDRDFFQYWEYQYNPDKGQTARGELRRWAESLYKDKMIAAYFETGSDSGERIEFKNELSTQLDAFMFLKDKFHVAYGFAAQPFAFLAHPKDAWALRLQIMASGPDNDQFKVNGILIVESHSIKEGEYCFVRK